VVVGVGNERDRARGLERDTTSVKGWSCWGKKLRRLPG
jgi:hypothetical protein